MGARKLLELVRHLPPEGAYARATKQHWTDALELRAEAVELAHALVRVTAAAAGADHLPEPLEVPRPKPELPGAPARQSQAEAAPGADAWAAFLMH